MSPTWPSVASCGARSGRRPRVNMPVLAAPSVNCERLPRRTEGDGRRPKRRARRRPGPPPTAGSGSGKVGMGVTPGRRKSIGVRAAHPSSANEGDEASGKFAEPSALDAGSFGMGELSAPESLLRQRRNDFAGRLRLGVDTVVQPGFAGDKYRRNAVPRRVGCQVASAARVGGQVDQTGMNPSPSRKKNPSCRCAVGSTCGSVMLGGDAAMGSRATPSSAAAGLAVRQTNINASVLPRTPHCMGTDLTRAVPDLHGCPCGHGSGMPAVQPAVSSRAPMSSIEQIRGQTTTLVGEARES